MSDKTLPILTIVVLVAVGLLTIILIGTSPEKSPAQNTMDGQLHIQDIQEGTGAAAQPGNTLSVHYVGTLADGTKFDSSRDRGAPFEFTLGAGQVISGWDSGMQGMKVSGMRRLTIPPELGYGSRAVGNIPPNATLIFEVELLAIK